MAATSADRRKLATLGAGQGDWCCSGPHSMLRGAGGASPPPAPTTSNLDLAPCAVSVGDGALGCARSQVTTQANRRNAGRREGRR
jgi:hypothetical protein